ncbi:GTP cyclohydrolase II [Aphanothece minutissima]|uniref:GTP cyclohydrolase II n=1 Tax=Aphanothece cf. minutissima CCALA 015 TaxID=2107695 RepID=A0ABX5FA35_9CHRO|nr:hypothetical protein C7B81_08200 [Aphanothece cf. minutissima CCALA 015]
MAISSTPRVASTMLTTAYGIFDFHCFSWGDHEEDNVLCMSRLEQSTLPHLCRIQSACYTAEIFQSLDCDCHEQLDFSLKRISIEGGLLIYCLCDGRGAGLYTKTLGLELGRTLGLDTSEAYEHLGVPQDPRTYDRASYILRFFDIKSVRLLTNNPRKILGLSAFGISVVRESLEVSATDYSADYLRAKKFKMGHLLSQFDFSSNSEQPDTPEAPS